MQSITEASSAPCAPRKVSSLRSGEKSLEGRVLPWATVSIFLATTAFMFGQSASPAILDELRRMPGAIADGELWRLVTPMVVHAGGWPQYGVNMAGLLVFGSLLEVRSRPRRMVLIYFASGVVGQVVGMAWRPNGAGASVGVAGIIGALAAAFVLRSDGRGRFVFLSLYMLIVVASLAAHDVHGLPALAGGILMAVLDARRTRMDILS